MNKQDILSSVFATLRLRSDLYFRAELRGDFAVSLPREDRHIRFHLVRCGQCWIGLPGITAQQVFEGDIAIVPDGSAQILSSDPGLRAAPLADVVGQSGGIQNGVLTHGSDGRLTGLLCGFCAFDEAIDHPVLAGLPGLNVLRRRELGAEPWVLATLQLLALEADLDAQGGHGVLSRLLEIAFIQAVRRMAADEETRGNGFIAALSSKQLSAALQAIHNAPENNWTITDLARCAGMSRAGFAQRFTESVGVPPIQYLTTWRLMTARKLLLGSDVDMADIALRCGYASVPSFSRRFKQTFGIGPGAYRRTML